MHCYKPNLTWHAKGSYYTFRKIGPVTRFERIKKCCAMNQTARGTQKDNVTHLGPVFSHVLYFDAEAATGACPVAKLELKTDEGTWPCRLPSMQAKA